MVARLAETWIVDRLNFTDDVVQGDRSERAGKYEYEDTGHSHGSAPRVERLRTYLEYHAMLLAAGEMVTQGRPLLVEDYEPFEDPWDSWLRPYLDSSPYSWTADLRSPAPLRPASYGKLGLPERWRQRTNEDFDAELGLNASSGQIVVDSYCSVSSPELHGSTFVSSALVSCGSAMALVRALQTCADPNDFRLPEVKTFDIDDMEIDEPGFRLCGWLLEHRDETSTLEENDPLRRGKPTFSGPGSDFVALCDLSRVRGGRGLVRADGTAVTYVEMWGDQPPAERGEYRRASYSAGCRTWVRLPELLDYLIAKRMDLIIEVRITRQYTERPSEEEVQYESGRSRIYLLRGDGTLETLGGYRHLGRADCL